MTTKPQHNLTQPPWLSIWTTSYLWYAQFDIGSQVKLFLTQDARKWKMFCSTFVLFWFKLSLLYQLLFNSIITHVLQNWSNCHLFKIFTIKPNINNKILYKSHVWKYFNFTALTGGNVLISKCFIVLTSNGAVIEIKSVYLKWFWKLIII